MKVLKSLIPFSSPSLKLPFWLRATGELILSQGALKTDSEDRKWLNRGGLFLLLRRGLAWVMDDRDVYSLEPGCIFYWEGPGDFHFITSSKKDGEASFILLDHQDSFEAFHPIFQSSSFSFPLGLSHEAATHLVSIYRSHKDGFAGDAFQISLKAYEFLMQLLRGLNASGQMGQPWITAALDIARANRGILQGDTLARQLGLEANMLDHEWMDKTGTTLEEFQEHIYLREQIFSHSEDNNKKLALILNHLNL